MGRSAANCTAPTGLPDGVANARPWVLGAIGAAAIASLIGLDLEWRNLVPDSGGLGAGLGASLGAGPGVSTAATPSAGPSGGETKRRVRSNANGRAAALAALKGGKKA